MRDFRRETLFHFASLPLSKSEKKYNLEQLRAIENGIMIKGIITNSVHFSVDTKKDLNKIKNIMGLINE